MGGQTRRQHTAQDGAYIANFLAHNAEESDMGNRNKINHIVTGILPGGRPFTVPVRQTLVRHIPNGINTPALTISLSPAASTCFRPSA